MTIIETAQSPALAAYCAQPIFRPGPDVYITGNPYRRPIGPVGPASGFAVPATLAEFLGPGQLAAGRILCNAYESDMILLPAAGLATAKDDFDLFYGDEIRRLRDTVRPGLERYAFSFLDDAVPAPPVRTLDDLQEYFLAEVGGAGAPADASGVNPAVDPAAPVGGTMRAITECRHPEEAAGLHLIQLALDALTEASAMARNLGGSYGTEQSELFKIFNDEFGYGVYGAKHSTIFKEMLASVGLRTDLHAYWNFYLTSSLIGVNYFNWLTEDHRGMFRYMAAVTYLEWLFAQGFADTGVMLRAVYGDRVDAKYCDEHAHIDVHHGRMTYENLLLGLARAHGEIVIPELVRGIEDTKLLLRLGDEDFRAQIAWADDLAAHTGTRTDARDDASVTTLRPDDPFTTGVHDADLLVEVEDGAVHVHAWATDRPHLLEKGDVLHVPAHRLHGLKAASPRARVATRTVETAERTHDA
ncbi:iron-containing redox enzyme family protein [Actinomadura sp. WMMB 499]|uniref:iron-containing redox enzyme family protein n=1 Tax=Actinomadura sp. WMMB 499 TaxID=1219491 RepID=UPI0012469869|nr:iron-containing redox enzyme family protein [Actinomadura sp. WMMB 499]QFG23127.1 iron-containing redox enzyme family protein [Actinomadura sp. WMMB 499]